jgi:hypothetical protein
MVLGGNYNKIKWKGVKVTIKITGIVNGQLIWQKIKAIKTVKTVHSLSSLSIRI